MTHIGSNDDFMQFLNDVSFNFQMQYLCKPKANSNVSFIERILLKVHAKAFNCRGRASGGINFFFINKIHVKSYIL